MAARLRLDRKTRAAIWVLVGIALAILGLVVRNVVISLTPEKLATLESGSSEDELLVIGGHSVLLKHGSATEQVVHSARGGDDDRAFEIDNDAFAPMSDQLTNEGSARAVQISDVMKHVPLLRAEIVPLADDHDTSLLSQRMRSFRANLIADGVPPARVTMSNDHGLGQSVRIHHPAQLMVVLTG